LPAIAARARVLARALLIPVLACCALAAEGAETAPPRLITVLTGDRSGVYYYAGGTICALVNAHRWSHGVRCIARQSGGSIENLQKLRRGDADFAIVQSDWQFHAVTGTAVFEGRGPDRSLRSVMALYPEPFSILARGTSGIARFSDLVGKRVSIGPAGSGGRATMETVMSEMGWTTADFAYLADLKATDLAKALCSGDIDAAVLVIAHPNLAVEDILSSCDIVLVPVDREITDSLVAKRPFFFRYAIPSGTYPGQTSNVDTFALSATLVTTAQTPPAAVRTLAEALVEGLPEFRARHPSFAELDTGQRLREGLTAPLHGAAQRFYEEAGLLPKGPTP